MVTAATTNALQWTFENNGDVIPLQNVLATDFFKKSGRSGFGVAPTKLITRDGASGGTRWRRTRRGARTIVLPVDIIGDSRQDIEDKQRRLVRLLQDDDSAAKIVATYPSSERFYTEVHYSGGADPQYGTDTDGRTHSVWALNLLAPDPYWTSETQIAYAIGPANAGHGLLPHLEKLQLSASQAIGQVLFENIGDVASYPIWTLRGPADAGFQARLPDGAGFSFNAALTTDSIITINTRDKTVIDESGNNRYTDLGDSPKLFPIPKGNTLVTVEMEGTTSASLISVYFNQRRELIF